MVRSEELHVTERGGNGRFSENEREILNEKGERERERAMPGGDMRVRAMLIRERRERDERDSDAERRESGR